jgi:hypothetical protein
MKRLRTEPRYSFEFQKQPPVLAQIADDPPDHTLTYRIGDKAEDLALSFETYA